jgi:anti-sigma-K factor RskA
VDAQMSHAELEQLAAGYVLGALEPDDEHAFAEHLTGCPVCQTQVGQLEGVVGQLARSVPQVEPARSLRAALRRKVGLTPGRRGVLAFHPRIPAAVWVRAAAVLGTLALFALAFWNFTLRNQAAYYAQFQQIARLANDPAAQHVRLVGANGRPGRGTVIAIPDRDEGALLVEGLPPTTGDRVYQLWALPPGGRLDRDAHPGRTWQPAEELLPLRFIGLPLEPATRFAVTQEPRGGSRTPTSDPVLVTDTSGSDRP